MILASETFTNLELQFWSCSCLVTKSCPAFCDPLYYNTPGFIILHYLPEFAQIHVHWVNNVISPSVAPFSFCPQSFASSWSFPKSWLFTSGGQSGGASASASVLPIIIQVWFTLELTGLISLQSKDFQNPSPSPQFESINSSVLNLLCGYMLILKTVLTMVWNTMHLDFRAYSTLELQNGSHQDSNECSSYQRAFQGS